MSQKWICNKCGYETTDRPKNKNATCENCNKGRYRVWNKCECGKWFHPQRADQKYCSKECMYKYRKSGGKKGKHYPHLQKAKIVVCPVCGKKFRAIHDFKDRKSVYCSKECWAKRAIKINYCLYCGKEIITSKSVNKKYCSNKCKKLHYRTINKGEKSHLWKGGKTKESKIRQTSAEYKEWRNNVFERDNYTCQKCGKKGDIEAHHIKEQCNYPELIFDINNGITLCRKCHKETDNYGWKAKKH